MHRAAAEPKEYASYRTALKPVLLLEQDGSDCFCLRKPARHPRMAQGGEAFSQPVEQQSTEPHPDEQAARNDGQQEQQQQGQQQEQVTDAGPPAAKDEGEGDERKKKKKMVIFLAYVGHGYVVRALGRASNSRHHAEPRLRRTPRICSPCRGQQLLLHIICTPALASANHPYQTTSSQPSTHTHTKSPTRVGHAAQPGRAHD